MIIADRAYGVEVTQIVFVRCEIAMPRNHIQRRMTDFCRPQIAAEFGNQFKVAFFVFIPCHRCLEITRIGQTVRTDHAQIRQFQHRAEVFADITTCFAVRQTHLKAHTARYHRDFLRFDQQATEFGQQQ